MKRVLTVAFLMGLFSASNAWAGINYIEYSQKYLRQSQHAAPSASEKDTPCTCKCCDGESQCNN